MKTPLRGRSGGHAGTAPTVSFGWIVHGSHRNMFRIRWIVCGAFICHRPVVDALFP